MTTHLSLRRHLTRTCGCSLLLLLSLSAGSSWAEEVVITDQARAHFRAGVNMLQDPDGARYAEAYREFRAAYDDSPSWKILGNLGITAMKLERDGEAIAAFRTYLAEGGEQIDPSERRQVQRDLETLEAGVVWVTVQTMPAGARLTDTRTPLAGRPVVNRYVSGNEPIEIGLHPGTHTIEAELEGYERAQWSFEAAPGTRLEQSLELRPREVQAPVAAPVNGGQIADSAPHRPVPTSVYVSLAAAGALAAGGAVTGVLALGKQRDYRDVNGVDADRAASLRSEGRTMNLVTDVLLGSALVAGGAAAFFYFTRPEVKPESAATFGVAPAPLPGGGGVWMQGSF